MSAALREALNDAVEALGDLSFECDGVTQTLAPTRDTYNHTFLKLKWLREFLLALPAEPAQGAAAPAEHARNCATRLDRAWAGACDCGAAPTREAGSVPAVEKELRRMLCVAQAGAGAYMDDGEAQDNSLIPCIDYMRDSPAEIRRKRVERHRVAANTQSTASEASGEVAK